MNRFLTLLVCLLPLLVRAGQAVVVSWDASPGATGYTVYYGTGSRNYTQTVDAGASASAILYNLPYGETFYIAVTARNAIYESAYSEEVSYRVPVPVKVASLNWGFVPGGDNPVTVEESTDLVNWSTLALITGDAGMTVDASGPQRFFRAHDTHGGLELDLKIP